MNTDQHWQQTGGDNLFSGQEPREYIEVLQNLASAFKLDDRHLRCMDEGTPGGIHAAGPLILKDVEEAVEILRGKVDGVTSHEECGACTLYATQNNLDKQESDEYGKIRAKELAEKLSVPYSHIKLENMARPSGLHIARCTYYDTTLSFDPSKVEKLPLGFVISRGLYSDKKYPQTELEVSIKIALGEHGFGEKFTADSPFYVVCVASDESELEKLQEEAREVGERFSGRVKVDGIVRV